MLFEAADALLLHNYVLAEFIPLCQVRGLNRAGALTFAADLLDSPLVDSRLGRRGTAPRPRSCKAEWTRPTRTAMPLASY